MSAPLLWLVSPAVLAFGLWFLKSRRRLTAALASGYCALLALLAWATPVTGLFKVGPLSVEVRDALVVLGRRFVLDSSDRGFLMLAFGFGAIWFFGVLTARVHRFFVPLGLVFLVLLVATLAVEPFLYAALLVEVAVLLSVPMMVPPGQRLGQGVLRYLIYLTLAMPFILLSGWYLGLVSSNPADSVLLLRASVLLGLGFAFWLAIFPFYTWIPLLAEQVQPYVSGFVLILLTTVILLLGLDFVSGFPLLRSAPYLPPALRLIGVLMVATAGVWTAFERNLQRIFGYAIIFETGFALIALGLNSAEGTRIFSLSFAPRIAALGVWALAMSFLGQRDITLDLAHLEGLLYRSPVISIALVASCLSIGGLPLLAGFPMRQALLEGLAQFSLTEGLWALLGSASFLASGFRVLGMVVRGKPQRLQFSESTVEILMLGIGVLALIAIGLLPQVMLPDLPGLVVGLPQP